MTKKNILHILEQYLIEQRGWSLRQPRLENAVLLLSGGLDSSLLAELCIKQLGTTVYPFYIKRGAKAQAFEEKAALSIVLYLQQKYADKMKDLYTIDVELPPKMIKQKLSLDYVQQFGYPMRNAIIEFYAVQYAVMLSQNGSPTHTIMLGSIGGDVRPDCQPDNFLTTTLTACIGLDDWDWQIIAPYFLEGLLPGRTSLEKEDIVTWGIANQFPFQLTRSCTSGSDIWCNNCTACIRRNKLFQQKGN